MDLASIVSTATALAFIAALALNMLMMARRWPSLMRALHGPLAPAQAPSRPPAEIIAFPVPVRRAARAPLRLAA